MRTGLAAPIAAIVALVPMSAANGAGDLAARAERLETRVLDAAGGVSIKEYELETGVFYRWRIESDGREEYKLVAPDLFRNVWIEQVSIEDKEVKPAGLHAVEFDDEGEIDIWFVPIRPGDYPFYVEALETQGFSGVMHVR